MKNNFDFQVKNRKGKIIEAYQKQDSTLNFLYGSFYGRIILKLLTRPFISKIAGWYMNGKRSCKMINGFIEKQGIDMSRFEEKEFNCYNDFFTRKIKDERKHIDSDENSLISPCDAKLTAYKIDDDSIFEIKNSFYSVYDLLGGNDKAFEFSEGVCLIFRLGVEDCHRYCYFDNGKKGKNVFIKGEFHTVKPIALNKYNIYKRNSREYTFLQTENFKEAAQIEIGAMMVGKIKNFHGEHTFKKGEEKGLFEFGGSTIVVLLKKDVAKIDSDILENTKNGIETVVEMGEKIGMKIE